MTSEAEHLVTRGELAQIMRVSVRTVDAMRADGMPCVTWGRRLVRFRPAEAMAWAQGRGDPRLRPTPTPRRVKPLSREERSALAAALEAIWGRRYPGTRWMVEWPAEPEPDA